MSMYFRACAALALLVAGACAHPPSFIRKDARLNALLYRPDRRPYLDNPRFQFKMDLSWEGPAEVEGGVRYREKRGRAGIAIAFYRKGTPKWRTPAAFRQYMREQGSVLDSHILGMVEISSRVADTARWETKRYEPGTRLGEKSETNLTEMLFIEDPEGNYVIAYEAPQRHFETYHGVFRKFLDSIVLPDVGGVKEKIVDPLGLRKDSKEEETREVKLKREYAQELSAQDLHFELSKRRWLAGMGLGLGVPVPKQGPQNSGLGSGPSLSFRGWYYLKERLLIGAEASLVKFAKKSESLPSLAVRTREAQSIALSFLGRWNFLRDGIFTPFVLAGIGVHQHTEKFAVTAPAPCAAGVCSSENRSSIGPTLTAGFGAESFLTPLLSVFAETRLQVQRMDGKKLRGETSVVSGLIGVHYRVQPKKRQ